MKRAIDFFLSGVGLIVLSPLFLVISVLIRIKLGSPVFFRQKRPGLGDLPFKLIKFRTMTDERGDDGELLSDKKRLTSFGHWLRSTSIDELPELWNVLKGEMSLVGPRPLLMEYLPLYSPEQARRHDVRPGITGWAQINGRNAIGWDEKFAADVWYVDNRSLPLDMKILFRTITTIVNKKGISHSSDTTMPRFSGNQGDK